jgi:hypothetical protein
VILIRESERRLAAVEPFWSSNVHPCPATEIGTREIMRRGGGILNDRLRLMFEWYKGMVDESTGRLLHLYDPEKDVTIGDGEPIRDIAAIWDVEVLSVFLGRDDLRSVIRRSLNHFEQLIVERDGHAIVAPQGEPSSIAHSTFLALALIRSELPDQDEASIDDFLNVPQKTR